MSFLGTDAVSQKKRKPYRYKNVKGEREPTQINQRYTTNMYPLPHAYRLGDCDH
ncbi:TPA: hypothetical protein QCX75_001104 [Bacillus mycoides]|uniref:hypothetical protein n=1 Tax=Bacillus sp. FSL P2-0099 TaxID=2921572 RepID=UPI0030F85606|nr:hypothetical protein [Bacillus mycoides]